ncbi:dTDP-6-deoxy-3,4-keto-hexulose isomerase [Dyadobacter beijingensis]|uniref:dTDP-6-deoxy-3,4-keto-hexulose isomerase n=1 Tax=Dyadobacter beijingensis TaxID=365489 RepID=A0ABQ2I1N4_9BACT|nr:FdtA/QdtA family cupin domain-containing protein [Dyadobacter beijingensis]GGM95903.1 dTDP-6-deoxy-3,4-keto-hexulose isomerase [Dyadobacter beijingensis]
MAQLINLKTITDTRGSLTVIERVIPFEIKRIFYVNGPEHFRQSGISRNGMRQAVICLKGSCHITSHTGIEEQHFVLDTADQCLLLAPEDSHRMRSFSDESILMVLASEPFEAEELAREPMQYKVSLAS